MPNPPLSPSLPGTPLLGDLSPEQFLQDYWQKKPLLVRQALTHFGARPSLADLCAMAGRDDVESRLVETRKGRWHCESGPFKPARFKKLGASDWALLLQSVNHHLPFCADLLYRFNFIPQVRLDDLMISHAPPGGSVGPHFDSYDVFLLQVGGRKRWQISAQTDLALVEDAPLKILQRFEPEQEWVLEHGDLLYLPPRFAHHGVALDEGQTWSIGFRAPTRQEIVTRFLDFLRDRLELDGIYTDPDLTPTTESARIPATFTAQINTMLDGLRWNPAWVNEFVGSAFSEPKPHIYFDPPDDELDWAEFAEAVQRQGIALNLKSILLFDDTQFYLNGEALVVAADARPALQTLANQRHLPAGDYPETLLDVLFEAHANGFMHLPTHSPTDAP